MDTPGRRTVFPLQLCLAAALALAAPARADELPDNYGRMSVENIWLTPAGAGGYSTLHFRLVNESRDHAHLLAVETPVAASARIVGRVDDHATMTIASLRVRADGDVDVGTDHTWVELGPLIRAVEVGQTIPVDLVFVENRVRVQAHVHSVDG